MPGCLYLFEILEKNEAARLRHGLSGPLIRLQ